MELALISYQLAVPQSPVQITYLGRDHGEIDSIKFLLKILQTISTFNMPSSINLLDITTALLDHGMMRVKQRIEEGQL